MGSESQSRGVRCGQGRGLGCIVRSEPRGGQEPGRQAGHGTKHQRAGPRRQPRMPPLRSPPCLGRSPSSAPDEEVGSAATLVAPTQASRWVHGCQAFDKLSTTRNSWDCILSKHFTMSQSYWDGFHVACGMSSCGFLWLPFPQMPGHLLIMGLGRQLQVRAR